MEFNKQYSTWVEVDLDAIQSNVRIVQQITGVSVMAVVKANGYGHGSVQTANAALKGGASWLAVARIEEALELRQAGLDSPILLLGYLPPQRYQEAIDQRVSITIWDREQIRLASSISTRTKKTANLHLKMDTGMGRLGVPPELVHDLVNFMHSQSGVFFEGIFTHFARADEPDQAPTIEQESNFQQVIATLEESGLHPALIHIANSAASLNCTFDYYDMVRLGIAMYGLHPSADCLLPEGFRPALSWKAILSQVKILPPGYGVSYGHEYVTKGWERIGTISVGYADGFRRAPNISVLVNGQIVPVIGRVCMDQIMVQLDKASNAVAGDEVVLIGYQGNNSIAAEEVARCWETINYEVVCGIGPRVPRIYSELL